MPVYQISCTTACSNPLLYGWLNSNFKKEFQEILCCKKIGNETQSQKEKGLESSFAVSKTKRRCLKDEEANGDTKLKAELLCPNSNNEEGAEYTM
jgi:hypothetical protein